jgi:hypothetical protein
MRYQRSRLRQTHLHLRRRPRSISVRAIPKASKPADGWGREEEEESSQAQIVMTSETINQHFVSRFYLNNFQIQPPSNVPRIWVLDKLNGHIFTSPIEKVGSENSFFDPSMEPKVTEIENIYQDAYTTLVARFNEGNTELQTNDISRLALLVAFQWLRTRGFRSRLDITIQANRQTIVDNFVNVEGYSIENAQALFPLAPSEDVQAGILVDREMLAMFGGTIISNFDWDVALAPPHKEFVTSDNPVAMSGRFLLDTANLISLPLSARVSVVLRLTKGKPVSRCGVCETGYAESVIFKCYYKAHRFVYASTRELLETTIAISKNYQVDTT